MGNSSYGIDFPSEEIMTDIKVTSLSAPQSSCPFRSARQKIFGLGYNLLLFVYDKHDTEDSCRIVFTNCAFIEKQRTGDYTITHRLIEMLHDGAYKEDIIAFLQDRNIPSGKYHKFNDTCHTTQTTNSCNV